MKHKIFYGLRKFLIYSLSLSVFLLLLMSIFINKTVLFVREIKRTSNDNGKLA